MYFHVTGRRYPLSLAVPVGLSHDADLMFTQSDGYGVDLIPVSGLVAQVVLAALATDVGTYCLRPRYRACSKGRRDTEGTAIEAQRG